MIDYQAIIDNLQDEAVFSLLEQLGAYPVDKGSYFLCHTICHNEDADEASPKLYYYKNSHLFYCYTECGSMSIFQFLRNYYETRNIVYDWYNDILQVIINCSVQMAPDHSNYRIKREDYYQKKNRIDLPTINEGLLDIFIHYYPIEWLNNSISPAVMDKYNIRYSISQNKIIIPHYDVNGHLIGIRGRALNFEECEQFGKYMPVQIGEKWYSHPLSMNLYGLNFNRDNIKKTRTAWVFESEKSVMQVESFSGVNCAVASCGSNLNKFQVDLLMRFGQPSEIIICYDNEELLNEDKYFNKLYKICQKYQNYCNMSFIYDRNKLTHLKDSPSDKGEAIFRQLLSERVKIK